MSVLSTLFKRICCEIRYFNTLTFFNCIFSRCWCYWSSGASSRLHFVNKTKTYRITTNQEQRTLPFGLVWYGLDRNLSWTDFSFNTEQKRHLRVICSEGLRYTQSKEHHIRVSTGDNEEEIQSYQMLSVRRIQRLTCQLFCAGPCTLHSRGDLSKRKFQHSAILEKFPTDGFSRCF